MKAKEAKQARATRQFFALKSQFMKLLLGAPDYGISGMALHFFDGEVTRIVFKFKESVLSTESADKSQTGGRNEAYEN